MDEIVALRAKMRAQFKESKALHQRAEAGMRVSLNNIREYIWTMKSAQDQLSEESQSDAQDRRRWQKDLQFSIEILKKCTQSQLAVSLTQN